MAKDVIPKKVLESKKELISVIMPVYHPDVKFLRIAINSLLRQTYKNLEILVIEDDPLGECKLLFKELNDSRIIHIENSVRLGIAKSLNKGIELSKGKYIARMDADDYALKYRLEKQYTYMEQNKNIDVLGTWSIGSNNNKIITIDDINPERRRVKQLFVNEGLLHPTVMFRSSFLKNNKIKYNDSFKMAEDYELWVNCCKIGVLKTLSIPTIVYRIHNMQVSKSGHEEEMSYINMLRKRELKKELSLNDCEAEKFIQFNIFSPCLKEIIRKLLTNNKKSKAYSNFYLEGEIGWRWLKSCWRNSDNIYTALLYGVVKIPCRLSVLLMYIVIVVCTRLKMKTKILRYRMSSNYKIDISEAEIIE